MLVGALGRGAVRAGARSPVFFQRSIAVRFQTSTSGKEAPEDIDWSKFDERYANREEVMSSFFEKGGEDGFGQRIPQFKIAAADWKHRYKGELPGQQARDWREWTDPRLHVRDVSSSTNVPFGFMVVVALFFGWQITIPFTGSYGSYPIYAAVPYVRAMLLDRMSSESFEQAKQDARVKKYHVVDHWTEAHTLEEPTRLGRFDAHLLEPLKKL